MSQLSAIDLSKLAPPEVVETLDFEVIREAMLADLCARDPDFTALVPSDPAYKIMEVAAYRELLLRHRINAASRAVMLAFATGRDLDHLAALFGVQRLLVSAADNSQMPPVAQVWENDERLRQRIILSLESLSTAGPVGAYRYHALAASAKVKDITVTSPSPGEVLITVLSTESRGIADEALLAVVDAALNADQVRPLTDHVIVQAAAIIDYTIEAHLQINAGPDPVLVLQAASDALDQYMSYQHRLGQAVTLSALYAALHQAGVKAVNLLRPTETINTTFEQAPFCCEVIINQADDD